MKKSIFAVSLLIAVSLCTSCANNNRDEDITPYETTVTAGTCVTEIQYPTTLEETCLPLTSSRVTSQETTSERKVTSSVKSTVKETTTKPAETTITSVTSVSTESISSEETSVTAGTTVTETIAEKPTETTVTTVETQPFITTVSTSEPAKVTGMDETTAHIAYVSTTSPEAIEAKNRTSVVTYTKKKDLPTRVMLNVKNVRQMPELPSGCEITSTTIALNYYGFKCSKMEMVNYLPMAVSPYDYYHWVTPWDAFVGHPKLRGYGCYSPVIIEAINNYWNAQEITGYEVVDLSGRDISDLYPEIAAGNPVIIWASISMRQITYGNSGWLTLDGKAFRWPSGEHCVVLIGYDRSKDTVTISDPWDSRGTVTYSRTAVEYPYKQLEKQALVIRKTQK